MTSSLATDWLAVCAGDACEQSVQPAGGTGSAGVALPGAVVGRQRRSAPERRQRVRPRQELAVAHDGGQHLPGYVN